jgi:putative SOS response-associated peptidase YedK
MEALVQQFRAELGPVQKWLPQFNIAPKDNVLAIRLADGRRQFALLNWSLVPSWSKGKKLPYTTFNARADRVKFAPAYRMAYKNRRCLVLADSYIEWQKAGKTRLPMRYEVDGGQPFAIAGLWESWHDPIDKTAPPFETCTVIVTDANELTAIVHDRMPVILDAEDYDAWLAGEEIPLIPFPAERMIAIPNTTLINNARNKGPECLAPREPNLFD